MGAKFFYIFCSLCTREGAIILAKKKSASSRPGKPVVWSEQDMQAYRKSPEYKRDVARAMAIRDEDIDYSGIPELTDEQLERMVQARAERLRKLKRPVYIRLDPDVLTWLKNQGPGYQTRINSILREKMEHSSPA